MDLQTYLEAAVIGPNEFAQRIGVSRQAVDRYRQRQRIPCPETMAAIVRESNGQVEPNDFYPSCQELLSRYRSTHRANGTKTNGKSARQTRMTS